MPILISMPIARNWRTDWDSYTPMSLSGRYRFRNRSDLSAVPDPEPARRVQSAWRRTARFAIVRAMLIRDSIHGDIELSRNEAAVLDCAEVQRLRGIKQLGTAYLVYPGCMHSRFEHSLGACAVSHRLVAALRRD